MSVDISTNQQAALNNAAEKCAELIQLASYLFTHSPKRLHPCCFDTLQAACDALDAVVRAGGKYPLETGGIALTEESDPRQRLSALTTALSLPFNPHKIPDPTRKINDANDLLSDPVGREEILFCLPLLYYFSNVNMVVDKNQFR